MEVSRRDFFKLSGAVVGAAVLKVASTKTIGERPYFDDETHPINKELEFERVVVGNVDVPTFATDNTIDSIPEVVNPLENSLIPRELLIDGLKLGDITVTNPNAEQVINVPLILDLYPNSPALRPNGEQVYDEKGNALTNYEAQLLRGAVLEVRKKEVNPENVYLEQALPGEVGDVYIFGHRVTKIHPDLDGDGLPDENQPKQSVFYRLGDLRPGAILGLSIDGNIVRYHMNEPVDQNGILVENPDGSQNNDGVSAVRAQNTEGKKQLKLVACHPPGKTTHRIVAVFEQIVA